MHVTATSAASTAFCAVKLEGPGGFIWLDGNGKITAGNGTLDAPVPNAFSLVQIEDCPGSTETCRLGCYVHGLEKHAPDTHALYRHNSQEIRRILKGMEFREWAQSLGKWVAANCAGGFRWHVSGDVFSDEYAQWITAVCKNSPDVRHWIYTRSFEFVPTLLKHADNLVVNLSADRDNYAHAVEVALEFGLRICYLTADGNVPDHLVEGDVIFPDYSLRGGTPEGQQWFKALPAEYRSYVCPVDYSGKTEKRRCGPCSRCMI
jgi:hypothetical protein